MQRRQWHWKAEAVAVRGASAAFYLVGVVAAATVEGGSGACMDGAGMDGSGCVGDGSCTLRILGAECTL